MLIIGLTLLTAGFIIIYKGTFAYIYPNFKSIFTFIAYIIMVSFKKFEYKLISFIATLIIGLFFQYNKSIFINPKSAYVIFNIKTADLFDVMCEILKNQNINYHITNNSILLDFPDKRTIDIKPTILGLNLLFLSDINNTDLLTLIENNLDIALNQMPHKKIPLFGTFVFALGLITTILFYIAIL